MYDEADDDVAYEFPPADIDRGTAQTNSDEVSYRIIIVIGGLQKYWTLFDLSLNSAKLFFLALGFNKTI